MKLVFICLAAALTTATLALYRFAGDGSGADMSSQVRGSIVVEDVALPRKKSYWVVKAYGPVTQALEEVYRHYARSLAGTAEVWIAYDRSCRPAQDVGINKLIKQGCDGEAQILESVTRLEKLAESEPNLKVAFHSDDVLEKRYPTMHAAKAVFKGKEPAYINSYYGVTFWFRNLLDTGVDTADVEYVWAVEADCLYSGNVLSFVNSVSDDPSTAGVDFLSSFVNHHDPGWAKIQSQNTWKIPVDQLWQASDFLVRLSPDLLFTLEGLMRLNAVMFGEAYAISICSAMEWCRVGIYPGTAMSSKRPEVAEEGCVLEWNCRVSWERWQRAMENPETRGYWYHACKFVFEPEVKGVYAAIGGPGGGGSTAGI